MDKLFGAGLIICGVIIMLFCIFFESTIEQTILAFVIVIHGKQILDHAE